ncbi:MAG: leucine-rich repeat domain-containing protein, partial [Clostridia bacterium]|nr:leucine-rich repeat domain-containing protein [Clostridia bacterium]
MNKKQFFIKLLAIVVGGVAVFLLSSCFTTMYVWSCKKSCMESCNSCNSSSEDDISGNEYGVYYTLDNSGEFYWVSEVGYKETEVKIPETYEGLPVMGLRYRMFEHYKHMGACSGGYYFGMHLSSLTLPKTIKVIDIGVFGGGIDNNYHTEVATCDKLIFEGTIEDWCSIEFRSNPFYGGTKFYIDGELLTDLVIPESVTKINANAFAYYDGLQSVTLHEAITEIGDEAFISCSNIKTITFPCKDLTIGNGAFISCLGLEKITFTGEKVVFGRSVFECCTALKEVEWNTVNITEISEYAFRCCEGLESFVIPASVERIGQNSFWECYNLIEVYNLSNFEVVAGSTAHGYVAYYAGVVHTEEGDNGSIVTEGDYKFVVSEEGATLFKYTGEGGVLNLPERS